MKQCKYNCGTKVIWGNEANFWIEADTGITHTYKRCAELLKSQGKKIDFFDKVKKK